MNRRWAEYWVRENLFHTATPSDGANVYSLLLPPPNVTGRLHMGHMLNHTEMDILARWQRMLGKDSMWLPGTDHAGIATQMMVERQLASEGKKRQDIGREAFLERVWQWKEQYGGYILEQMKRLGDSVDWSREFFTMDEQLSRAVREAFVRFWEEGSDLSRHLHRQLVSALPDRAERPRSGARGDPGQALGDSLSRRRPCRANPSSSPPRVRRPCSATLPSPSIRAMSATPICTAGR